MSRNSALKVFIMAVVALGSAFTMGGGFVTLSSADAPSASLAAQQEELGREIYEIRCQVCHGAEGDGAGPAATLLDPRPRDFRRGWYKIRTTVSGQLPTDADLFQIINDGMPGTTMPGWDGVLTDAEIEAVASYIKGFARRFERETPELILVGPKIDASDESIARGAELFTGPEAECIKCHGLAGRGDGPSADELTEDFFEDVIVPADLTMPWLFRGGSAVEDIYMRLKTGWTGSPMPSYEPVLADEDIWHLANYVDSLGPDAQPEVKPAITASLVQGPIPEDPDADLWQDAPEFYYPFVGQIMREQRNFTPSIVGVWVRALYNESELALLLRWHDRFTDIGDEGGPHDAMAIQFPAELVEGFERPYFVFGDTKNPVNLWIYNADADSVEERNGRGVGNDTVQTTQNVKGASSFADGQYTLLLRRALKTVDPEDIQFELGRFIPIAFSAWDGWRGEKDAAGAITSWSTIFLEPQTSPLTYLAVPAVVVVITTLIEGLIVWNVRRRETQNGANSE